MPPIVLKLTWQGSSRSDIIESTINRLLHKYSAKETSKALTDQLPSRPATQLQILIFLFSRKTARYNRQISFGCLPSRKTRYTAVKPASDVYPPRSRPDTTGNPASDFQPSGRRSDTTTDSISNLSSSRCSPRDYTRSCPNKRSGLCNASRISW